MGYSIEFGEMTMDMLKEVQHMRNEYIKSDYPYKICRPSQTSESFEAVIYDVLADALDTYKARLEIVEKYHKEEKGGATDGTDDV